MIFNLDQMAGYEDEVKDAINRVLDKKQFILGKEVELFEGEFAAAVQQRYCVGVGNGTDAIRLALLALGIGPGDEVISPAFNVAYTALAVSAVGAINRFVDCNPNTLLMDLNKVEEAITSRTRAIIPVHLYGQMVNMFVLHGIATKHNLVLIEDAAQAHLSKHQGYFPGKYSHAVAYSFYPTKNLGALGEAGGVTTNIPIVAERLRLLRDGGRTDRYLHTLPGLNSCLDEMQAAILRVKLRHLIDSNDCRQAIAAQYDSGLSTIPHIRLVRSPEHSIENVHTYHLYVIRAEKRDELRSYLQSVGIPTLVHYPVPVPLQPCFISGLPEGPWPEADRACREVVSLPMYPSITPEEIDQVVDTIKRFYNAIQ